MGGLSVYQEIKRRLPQATYTYVFDNGAFPYGELPPSTLVDRVVAIIKDRVAARDIDLVVIACNTASTVVLPPLREQLSIPVVGVVPAIKPAASASKVGVIGLLATPATVSRPYTDELISRFAEHCKVLRVGSTRLVEIAEDKLRGIPAPLGELAQILSPFKGAVDQLILGCTHFPLLREEICAVLEEAVSVIDSGAAIANRVVSLLEGSTLKEQGAHQVYCTLADKNCLALHSYLEQQALSAPQVISLTLPDA
nr:glutamate racemase [Thaumasiovibrio subtropicus]